MDKREMLKHKQLMIWARTGYWVTQSSLDEVFMSDDELVLEQIESLRELKEQYPKLSKEVNQDLGELLTNQNAIGIKKYNELYATNLRNNTEEELIEILFWLSVFEGSGLTQKQKDLLIDVVSGYSYEGNAKNRNFLIKKLEKSKGGVNKMNNDKKRQFTAEEMRRLFPSYYSKENSYYDNYLNISKKLDVYQQSVEESKVRMDRIRQLSLEANIKPLTLECNEVKE